jgi:hypothetical protein
MMKIRAYLSIFFLVVLGSFLFTSCQSCERTKEKKHAVSVAKLKEVQRQLKISIERYEVDFFAVSNDNFVEDLKKLQKKYPFFLEGDLDDVRNQRQLWSYLNDPLIKEIYELTMKKYPDLNDLTAQFREAFSYYSTYFPEEKIPHIYTYVSGLDYEMPIKLMDSILVIALDMYLGANYKYYNELGIPQYVSSRFQKEYILPNCFSEISYLHSSNPKTCVTVLDHMIYEGRRIYFTEMMLPNLHDTLLIGYSGAGLNWAKQNEGNVWGYFLDNEILYSKESKAVVKLIQEAPFTSYFSKESPGRMGIWIGWQIVRKYMNGNDVELGDFMQEENYKMVLEKSRYKPKK